MGGRTRISLLACLFALVLAGCGSDGGTIPENQCQRPPALLDTCSRTSRAATATPPRDFAQEFADRVDELPSGRRRRRARGARQGGAQPRPARLELEPVRRARGRRHGRGRRRADHREQLDGRGDRPARPPPRSRRRARPQRRPRGDHHSAARGQPGPGRLRDDPAGDPADRQRGTARRRLGLEAPRRPAAASARAGAPDERDDLRSLRARRPPGLGRDVDRLPGHRPRARAHRGGQDPRRAPLRRRQVRRPLPPRGARGREADPPEHRPGLRHGRRHRPPLHRHGVRRGQVGRPAAADARAAGARRRGRDRDPVLRRARVRPPPGDHPPRRQAREPDGDRRPGRAPPPRQLRPRAADRRDDGQADRLRHRPRERPDPPHAGRLGGRHRRLPGARAGARRGGDPGRRRLRARRLPLPAAHRAPAVGGLDARRARQPARERDPAAADLLRPRRARDALGRRPALARGRRRGPLLVGPRALAGARGRAARRGAAPRPRTSCRPT